MHKHMNSNKETYYFIAAGLMLTGAFGPPELGLGCVWQFLNWMGWL